MTVQYFRFLLIASFVIGVFSGGVDFVFPELLSETYKEAIDAHYLAFSTQRWLFLGCSMAALFFTVIASYYGLYRLRPWAPRLSLVSTALGLIVVLAAGTSTLSGLATAASYLSSYIWGIVLALVFFTPFNAHFRRDNI